MLNTSSLQSTSCSSTTSTGWDETFAEVVVPFSQPEPIFLLCCRGCHSEGEAGSVNKTLRFECELLLRRVQDLALSILFRIQFQKQKCLEYVYDGIIPLKEYYLLMTDYGGVRCIETVCKSTLDTVIKPTDSYKKLKRLQSTLTIDLEYLTECQQVLARRDCELTIQRFKMRNVFGNPHLVAGELCTEILNSIIFDLLRNPTISTKNEKLGFIHSINELRIQNKINSSFPHEGKISLN